MKKIYFLLLSAIMLTTIKSTAQLNYVLSASSKPYVPVTGGITPPLKTDYTGWETRDEGFGRVPIGFTFNYDGENYTMANVDVNGFITLKDSLDIFYNYPYFLNRLGQYPYYNKRPVIAAFWDDLLLADTLDLVYKTTGHAPFRVFTIEWKKAKWVYESVAPVLSIELKLYETSNIIEFDYKDEGGLPDPRYAFASIGISSEYAHRDFISLLSTSSHPQISLLKANDSLTVKPANNQVYRFIPAFPKMLEPLESSLKYTNNNVSFNLKTGAFNNGYEYALTHSSIAPTSGILTSSSKITISSLLPATTYYIYGRSKLSGLSSQWVCDSFTTAVKPVELPYSADVDGATYPPWIPSDMRQQDFEDTFYQYDPGLGWFGFLDFPNAGDIGFGYYQVDFYDANAWLYTPGIKLIGGKTYQLKFGYTSFFEFNPEDPAALEVKFGRANGVAAMTSGTLFKNTDITNYDITKDTVIEITPDRSGAYYFGFHDMSLFFQGGIIVSNISVTEKTSSSEIPVALNGKTNSTDNVLNWALTNKQNNTGFEMQRSADGINFTTINKLSPQALNKKIPKNHTSFRVYRNTEIAATANIKDKHSQAFDESMAGIELQRNDDGINFKRLSTSTSKSSNKADAKISYDYIDHDAKGINYYRLQQKDKNGKLSYSNIVKLESKTNNLSIYPNPAKDVLNVKIESANTNKIDVIVTDVAKKIWITKPVELQKGANNIQLATHFLPAGTYFLKIINTEGRENAVMEFVKQ